MHLAFAEVQWLLTPREFTHVFPSFCYSSDCFSLHCYNSGWCSECSLRARHCFERLIRMTAFDLNNNFGSREYLQNLSSDNSNWGNKKFNILPTTCDRARNQIQAVWLVAHALDHRPCSSLQYFCKTFLSGFTISTLDLLGIFTLQFVQNSLWSCNPLAWNSQWLFLALSIKSKLLIMVHKTLHGLALPTLQPHLATVSLTLFRSISWLCSSLPSHKDPCKSNLLPGFSPHSCILSFRSYC